MTDFADTASGPGPEPAEAAAVPARALSPVRPLYWSVRRELWENRAIWFAPLAAAGVVLLGFLLALGHGGHFHFHTNLSPAQEGEMRTVPYGAAAFVVILTSFIVAFFYCLGALGGERRDRSILFWKSLPVSDLTTVLSKALIPLVVLPVVIFAVVVVLQLVMLTLATAHLVFTGQSVMALWTEVALTRMWLVLAYGLVVMALWYAPIWGWLLLVSGWARGMTFLWAVGPWLALCIVEKIGFDTGAVASMLKYRLAGEFGAAFNAVGEGGPVMELSQLDPARFLATPGLWVGLAFAALFIAAAVRQRRHRGPL